jgi:hypothetical protein
MRFGARTVSAQWFDTDGKAITGEFLLLDSWDFARSSWLETSPLIGGGLVVSRRDAGDYFNGNIASSNEFLVTVASGATSAATAPEWMRSRPNTRLAIIRGGQAYAMLPNGAMNVHCGQTVGVVAPDGTWCGSADYPIAAGTCDTPDLTVGADGTVIQQLPLDREQANNVTYSHSCTWRWWAGALK